MKEIPLSEFKKILPAGAWFNVAYRDGSGLTPGRCRLSRWGMRDVSIEKTDGFLSYISYSELNVLDEGGGVYSLSHGEEKFMWVSDIGSKMNYARKGLGAWQ